MKSYKITAKIDGVRQEIYEDAPDAYTATQRVINTGLVVTILKVELLNDDAD